jgi:hypothetical protein
MSLVATGTEALITVVMRMHWPPEGSSSDLEITGAGPQHLPYDRLWAVDDEGTRYTVRFEAGQGETAAWRGVIQLSPVPSRRARWLDLIGDGTRLLRLPLQPAAAPRRRRAPPSPAPPSPAPPSPEPEPEPAAIPPADHLLRLAAERILATGDAGPAEGPGPGEIITVLTEAGAIAAGNPLPGQLAALCRRLGAAGHGITVPPAADIPAEWASVVAHRDAPVPGGAPELFAPLAAVLPDVGGGRIAVAGLSSAAGESHLHVVSTGLPPVADWFAYNWTPGFSWWLTDGGGNWHVGTAGEPWTFGDGIQAFRLRLTPPLTSVPDAAELVLTGPFTQVRVRFPVIGPGLRSARRRSGGQLRRSAGQGAGQTELRERAGIEAGHGADAVAGQGEDEQPGRVEDSGLRILGVHAERGLAVGPGRDEAGPAAGAEPGGGEEPGDQLAAVVFQRKRRHGRGDVLGEQGDDAGDVAGLVGAGEPVDQVPFPGGARARG